MPIGPLTSPIVPSKTAPTYPSPQDITQLEKESNRDGIKGKVKNNGGDPDGKLGKNDLDAIMKYGKDSGVSDDLLGKAKLLKDDFNIFATDFGGDKYITPSYNPDGHN